jgi:coenzyme F420-0:L-glutamate ligase/coenzyme F420-1:gamma-L-glutamate ligase
MIACAARLEVFAVPGVPLVGPGADLPAILSRALASAGIKLANGDVLVVTSKLLSRAEGRFVELPTVRPSPRALDLAQRVDKDARLVELILRESSAVSRATRGVLVVRHRLGFVVANAGIDASNAVPPGSAPESGPWALLLPEAPDASAAAIRARLELESHARIGVVVSDSFGRPFRLGIAAALGSARGAGSVRARAGTNRHGPGRPGRCGGRPGRRTGRGGPAARARARPHVWSERTRGAEPGAHPRRGSLRMKVTALTEDRSA